MNSFIGRDEPALRYEGGPTRVVTNAPDPDFVPPPFLGFAPQKKKPLEVEPDLWEGDNA